MPLVPLDFDERHDRCAPDDQQLAHPLVGGELVEIRNMTGDGLLRFAIPHAPLIFSTRIAGTVRHHNASIQTVILEPDLRRVVLVWATAVPCHHSLYSLEGTWVRELPRTQPRAEKMPLYAISRRPR